ncbi:MAG: elongation factor P-like protein YeiP [Lentisphaerae bacterium RIFOXYA12_FULL_48_11]|nr:MAG: elongation factor P-like protein YeiP [Lentisphaerae bacterium RIFOXYA12_FULL_48_11]
MIRACDFKKGDVVLIGEDPHIIESIVVQTPAARGTSTLYKVRFRNVQTKRKVDEAFRGDDVLKEADFERREIQYLYKDASGCTFMDLTDYSQFTLIEEDLENELPYLTDGLEGIFSLVSGERVLGIELPPVVEMKVIETDPALKGASATSRNKPAKMATGLVVLVPEYLSVGEKIRVDTRTGLFVSRA